MADSTLKDPLGRVLVLSERTWYGHVLRGHPEMKGLRRLVEAAIRRPDEVRFSQSDPDCRLYFAAGPRPALRILVVGDVVGGFVKTAHLARRISGGDREWPS